MNAPQNQSIFRWPYQKSRKISLPIFVSHTHCLSTNCHCLICYYKNIPAPVRRNHKHKTKTFIESHDLMVPYSPGDGQCSIWTWQECKWEWKRRHHMSACDTATRNNCAWISFRWWCRTRTFMHTTGTWEKGREQNGKFQNRSLDHFLSLSCTLDHTYCADLYSPIDLSVGPNLLNEFRNIRSWFQKCPVKYAPCDHTMIFTKIDEIPLYFRGSNWFPLMTKFLCHSILIIFKNALHCSISSPLRMIPTILAEWFKQFSLENAHFSIVKSAQNDSANYFSRMHTFACSAFSFDTQWSAGDCKTGKIV